MLRIVLALMLVTVACVAQPIRLWKRDGHADVPRVVGLDSARNVYTEAEGVLYKWDTRADTVIQRLHLAGTEVNRRHPEMVLLLNDSMLFIEQGTISNRDSTRLIRLKDGSTSLVKQLRLWWIDEKARVGLTPKVDSLTFYDLTTMDSIRTLMWDNPKTDFEAYDRVRQIMYARDRNVLYGVDTQGIRTDVGGIVLNDGEYIRDVMLLDDGNLLVGASTFEDNVTRLCIVNPITNVVLDSFFITPRLTGWNGDNVLYELSDGRILLYDPYDGFVFFERQPLRIQRIIKPPFTARRPHIASVDSIFVTTQEGAVLLINSLTGSIDEIIPVRHEVKSATQLHDGRFVTAHFKILPEVLDVATGNRQGPLWSSHPLLTSGPYTLILAAKAAPIVALCSPLQCYILRTTDTTTVARITPSKKLPFSTITPVLFDSMGSELIGYTTFDDVYNGGSEWGTSVVKLDATRDSSLSGRIDGNYFRDYTPSRYKVPSLSLGSTRHYGLLEFSRSFFPDTVTFALNGIGQASWPTYDFHSYDLVSATVMLDSESEGVIDDPFGLAIIDCKDKSVYRMIGFGVHHYPVARLNKSNQVITYSNNQIHGVDIEAKRIIWSMPVAARPYHILVDRADRWFVCLYLEDYIEMFALDHTVDVDDDAAAIGARRAARNVNNTINVFPNPSFETLSVSAPYSITEYVLYDVLGSIMTSAKLDLPAMSCMVDVHGLAHGTYLMSVHTTRGWTTTVVQKHGR